MSRNPKKLKIPWPFVVVIVSSFLLGAAWGWKLIQDRAVDSGRLAADAKLRILAPAGIFSQELLSRFQKETRIAVDVTSETFPGALLRRALKAAPGQFDLVLVYHHQVSALRSERKLVDLWDARSKFPIVIAPDFRKLPDDRNLMETAPILWGLLGIVTSPSFNGNAKWSVWPSFAIGLTGDAAETPAAFRGKAQTLLAPLAEFEKNLMKSPSGPVLQMSKSTFLSPMMTSHASLEFSPLKDLKNELKLEFRGLQSSAEASPKYALWILTLAAVADGELENSRRFVRFLIEPENNIALVEFAKVGASTLRANDGLKKLPENLLASHFRKFPLDEISIERDDLVRQADDILEQTIRGAIVPASAPKPVVTAATPQPVPPPRPSPNPTPKIISKSKPTDAPASASKSATEPVMDSATSKEVEAPLATDANEASTPEPSTPETAPAAE